MPKKLKYRKGFIIESLTELDLCLYHNLWIYLWDTPKHPRFIEHMTLHTVKVFINRKALRLAILN